MNWYESNTGNHQGLIVDEDNGDNIAVSYDKKHAALIAAAPLMHKELEHAEQTLRNLGNGDLVGDAQTIALNAAKNIRNTLAKATP